jgi:hypothetical protein
MSRFIFALLSMALFVGSSSALVSEARAAAVCDATACVNNRCKNAKGHGIQRCSSNCQIDVAENKKKGLCK